MAFSITNAIVCLTFIAPAFSQSTSPGIHLPLFRRGGRFSLHESANLTRLTGILHDVEAKYARSQRAVDGNQLVRRWRSSEGRDENDPEVVDVAGRDNQWYTLLEVGNPKQLLKVDLDMLSPDFYTIVTTSRNGVGYDASASESHGFSERRVHPICKTSSDDFHFPELFAVRLDLPICSPAKASRQTLANSGSSLGLAPHAGSLARLASPPLLRQLSEKDLVKEQIWSVTLLDAENGILSLGGTIARDIEEAKVRGEIELKHFGDPVATSEWVIEQVEARLNFLLPPETPWDKHFKWTEVQGAAGWWTALMRGVWVSGAKVLKNQPVLFDINAPFILAPPVAAKRFYESIGGTKRLPSPYDNFFAFPCLNRANIAFEIGGWSFPTMQGEGTSADALFGPAGGSFSLGKVADGTGYCVGSVVETKMALSREGLESGMKDMWVLGEPFFRGLGVVFDVDEGKVGMRTY
ncbi:hypothetical protein H2200_010068 [Cladophialophora chaetospira]|uniref:Peptidase A1 domain-containing protein n=1 Tax=Cladophialophora chaetospira TaxID=386627 RepID=A0AA38X242_9EURO|nr:hypothetical protein H2200_010068 [Cladophialophora chaetospira]